MLDFFSQQPAHALSHEAVIEIMIGLLGLMIAILTLIAGLFATVIGVIGFFGFNTIRDEAVRKATMMADQTARNVALQATEGIKGEALNQMWAQIQASGMSEGQAEPTTEVLRGVNAAAMKSGSSTKKRRRKATSDKNLKEAGE